MLNYILAYSPFLGLCKQFIVIAVISKIFSPSPSLSLSLCFTLSILLIFTSFSVVLFIYFLLLPSFFVIGAVVLRWCLARFPYFFLSLPVLPHLPLLHSHLLPLIMSVMKTSTLLLMNMH